MGANFASGRYGVGRHPLDPALKEMAQFNTSYLRAKITQYLLMDFGELVSLLDKNNPKRKKLAVIDLMLASMCATTIQEGDTNRFNALMNRLIGPVTEKLQVEGSFSHASIIAYIEGKKAETIEADYKE